MAERWVLESAAGDHIGDGNPFDGPILDGK